MWQTNKQTNKQTNRPMYGGMLLLDHPLLSSRGNKYHLMTKSRLRVGTEPAVFVPEVAKQHDVFASAIPFGVLVSVRASFCWIKWFGNSPSASTKICQNRHLFPRPCPCSFRCVFVWKRFSSRSITKSLISNQTWKGCDKLPLRLLTMLDIKVFGSYIFTSAIFDAI